MRWIRVLGFATIYFFIYLISFIIHFLYSLGSHMTVYSFTLEWLFYHDFPWFALRIILTELTRNSLSILIAILCSFILGFTTDWVLRTLKRRILFRMGEQRTEFNHPKT
jgi:hypothetical protein